METDENALGGAAANVGGTGDCFGRGHWVEPGDVIGAVGATALCESGQGTHLHFAIYVDGSCVDPLIYLPA